MKKKTIKYTGSLIAVFSALYVIRVISKTDWDSVLAFSSPVWIPVIIVLISLYMVVNLIRALNWTRIIDYLGNSGKYNKRLMIIYLKTEVAKYLPSNMVHLAGRHILARGLGFKDSVLLAANILDMVLLLFVSLSVVFIGFLTGIIEIPSLIIKSLSVIPYNAVLVILILSGSLIFLWLFKSHRMKIKEFIKPGKISEFVIVIFLFIPGFLINSIILYVIYKYMLGVNITLFEFGYFFVAFTMAWAAGFIIPGAPGGIGVRESVILVLFGGIYGDSTAVIAAVLMRLISVAGDAGVWLISWFFEKCVHMDWITDQKESN